MRKKNKLYTANKWNQPLFMPEDEEPNLFKDGGFTQDSFWSNPSLGNSGVFGRMSSLGNNSLSASLSAPTVGQPINWGNSLQASNALTDSQNLVSGFGAEASKNNALNKVGEGAKTTGAGLNIGGMAKAAAPAAAGAIGGIANSAISDGMSTKAGSTISSAGMAIGGAVAAVNPLIGAAIMVGSQIIGGLTNRAFGHKVNQATIDKVNASNNRIDSAANAVSNASTSDDLLNASDNMMAGTMGISKKGFKDGWLNKKATKKWKNLIAQNKLAVKRGAHALTTGAEKVDNIMDDNAMANYVAFGGPINRINDDDMSAINYGFMNDYLMTKNKSAEAKNGKVSNNVFGSLAVTPFALGGVLQSQGADWSTGLSQINAGLSHELNPYEGVQVGLDPEGNPNLVEEGETIFDDYVYSRRIKVDDETKRKFHLGKKADITFADLSKKLEKESQERPNDPISQRALTEQMHLLAEEQERQKAEAQQQQMQKVFNALPLEQQQGLIQMAMQEQQNQAMQQQAMKQEAMMQQQGQQPDMPTEEQVAGNVLMQQENQPLLDGTINCFGGKLNKFGYGGSKQDWLDKNFSDLSPQTRDKLREILRSRIKPGHAGDYSSLRPSYNGFSSPKIQDHFNDLVNSGISPEEAYKFIVPRGKEWYDRNLANVDRQKLYSTLINGLSNPNNTYSKRTVYKAMSGKVFNTREEAVAENKRFRQQQAASNTKSSSNASASSTSTASPQGSTVPAGNKSRGTSRRQETSQSVSTGRRGDSGLMLYDWYFDGSDGYSTPTGFVVGDKGIIDPSTYTDEYKNLVENLSADDIREWAKSHPTDSSLKSFLAKGNKLEDLTDEQWRTGALDGKYGFMHHVADQLLNGSLGELASEFGDGNPIEVEENPGEDIFVEVDENGEPVVTAATVEEKEQKQSPELHPTWGRYAGLFGPAIGLGMQLAGVGKPDYSGLNAALEATSGGVATADYKPIGNYLRYEPMDIWAEQNRLNANARATDRAIMNNAGPLGTKMAGLLASNYNDQLGSGQLYRSALEYNDNKRHQVADFNRTTDMFNADAYNKVSMANAEMLNNQRRINASLAMDAARTKLAMDNNWNQGIYGNVSGLFEGLSNWGQENELINWRNKMAADELFGKLNENYQNIAKGVLKTTDVDDTSKKKKSKGGKLKKKRRGLTF